MAETRLVVEIDIYRSANVLICQHGENAALEAAMRADAMLERGDSDGCAAWKRILRATETLLSFALIESAPRPEIPKLRKIGVLSRTRH